jgi:hypothetical protein
MLNDVNAMRWTLGRKFRSSHRRARFEPVEAGLRAMTKQADGRLLVRITTKGSL